MESITEWTLRKSCPILIFINLVCILFRTGDCYGCNINLALSVSLWCKHCFFILSVYLYHWSSITLKAVFYSVWTHVGFVAVCHSLLERLYQLLQMRQISFFLSLLSVLLTCPHSLYSVCVCVSLSLSYFLISILKPNMLRNVWIVQWARPVSVILHLKTTSDVEEGGSISLI